MCIFFQVEAPVPVVAGAWGIATLDINADGIPDFVVAGGTSNAITVLTSNGQGGFTTETTVAAGKGPEAIAVGDFNGDGKQDVVVADTGGNTVAVLINNGSGGFDKAVTVAVGAGPAAVIATDLNGDNKTDIVAANTGGTSISVLINNGAGGFTTTNYSVGKNPTSVVAAELANGSKPNLVVALGSTGQVGVLTNNGSGVFTTQANYAVGGSTSSDPQAVTTADLLGNGDQDVLVADGNGTVSVLLGNGTGTLQPAQTFHIGTDLTAITTATLDGTGVTYILVADAGTDSIDVLDYAGGTLAVVDQFQFAAAVVGMSVVDVNDDGRPDIVATLANGSIDVVLNQSDYTAAQAVAAYAANPALTGMTVADTGAALTANLAALEMLAGAGALASVTDTNAAPVAVTSAQLFADAALLSELVSAPLSLSAGPLALAANASLFAAAGTVTVVGSLTNSGSVTASASGGALTLAAAQFGSFFDGTFANLGTLTLGNAYALSIDTGFINRGLVKIGGGAELAVVPAPWANTGTIAISAATLLLGGSLGIGQLGSIVNTGGIVDIAGTLSGPSTLQVGSGSALGTVQLQGTIETATIADAGGGMEFIGDTPGRGGAALQNVNYAGTLLLNLSGDAVTLSKSVKLLGASGTGAGNVQLTGSNALLSVSGMATLDNATIHIGSLFPGTPSELYAEGAALTLGAHLSIVQVGNGALLQSDRGIGDGIVNSGTITAAVAGGEFVVSGGNFTNLGSLTVGNGDSVVIETDHEGNLAGGTLSGGSWAVSGASTLWLPDDANVTTLAAKLTLAGSYPVAPAVEWFSTAAEADVTLQQTLATIAAAGVLTLSGNYTFASTTTSGGLDVLGKVVLAGADLSAASVTVGATGSVSGTGGVVGPIANNGGITASGGLLDLSGALSGTGTLTVASGATLELGGSAPSTEKVVFAAAKGALVLNAPTSDAVTVSGFVKGDTIDLRGFVETGDTYNAATGVLTVTGSGGATVALTFLGTYTLASFKFGTDSSGGTLLTDPPPSVAKALAAVALSPELIAAAAQSSAVEASATQDAAPQPELASGGGSGGDAASVHPVAAVWPPTG